MQAEPEIPPSFVRFGVFVFAPRTGELWRSGLPVRLQEKPARILALLLEQPGHQRHGALSTDGAWLAYVNGVLENQTLRLCRMPDCAQPQVVVQDRVCAAPMWAPDGRTLYYRSSHRMMAVTLTGSLTDSGGQLRVPEPRTLFEGQYARADYWTRNAALSPEGTRFLLARNTEAQDPPQRVQMILDGEPLR